MMKPSRTVKTIAASAIALSAIFFSAAHAQTPGAEVYQLPDMTSHPLAGSEVEMQVVVKDALGQQGRSKIVKIKLPQIKFRHALNPALASFRKTLALDSRQAGTVTAGLAKIMQDTPPANLTTRAALESVYQTLKTAKDLDTLELVVGDLWRVMLLLEEDSATQAEKNLRDAEKKLQDAIDKGLSEEELKKLAEESQKAMEEYLKEKAEQENDPEAKKALEEMRKMQEEMRKLQEEMKKMDAQSAQKIANQMKQMQQQGQSQKNMQKSMQQQMQEMEQQLKEMKEMKERLEALQKIIKEQEQLTKDTEQEAKDQKSDKPNMDKIQNKLEELADALRKRADVWRDGDEDANKKKRFDDLSREAKDIQNALEEKRNQKSPLTEREAEENISKLSDLDKRLRKEMYPDSPRNAEPKPEEGKPAPAKPKNLQEKMKNLQEQTNQNTETENLRQKQRNLEWEAQKIINQMKSKGMDTSKLNGATKKMEEATDDLSNDQAGDAVPDQQEAIDLLRQAEQEMQQQMQQQMGKGSGAPEMGDRGGDMKDRPDPLGRSNPNANMGVDPQKGENQSRIVRDEIRDRLQNPNLPSKDRDYLERLLNNPNNRPSPR